MCLLESRCWICVFSGTSISLGLLLGLFDITEYLFWWKIANGDYTTHNLRADWSIWFFQFWLRARQNRTVSNSFSGVSGVSIAMIIHIYVITHICGTYRFCRVICHAQADDEITSKDISSPCHLFKLIA